METESRIQEPEASLFTLCYLMTGYLPLDEFFTNSFRLKFEIITLWEVNKITLASTSSCKMFNTVVSNVISFTSQDVIVSNLSMNHVKLSTVVYILMSELLQKQRWKADIGESWRLCINEPGICSGKNRLCLKRDRRQGQTPNIALWPSYMCLLHLQVTALCIIHKHR